MKDLDSFKEQIKNSGDSFTGSHEEFDEFKIITYPFGKYEIKVKLSLANQFIGIVEVKINKTFLSHKQKITSKGYHDVDEFYRK